MGKLVKILKAIGRFFSWLLAGMAASRAGGGVTWEERQEELGDIPPQD
jgi:hypothetical protein